MLRDERIPRGRKPAVSPYERRRWAEELDKGKGITEISKAAGRDIRVVKRHIEIAREEAQTAQTRRDFLLIRLQQHQDDLLGEVERSSQLVVGFPPVKLEPPGGLEKKRYDALSEHLRSLALHKLLLAYQLASQGYEASKTEVVAQFSDEEAKLKAQLPQGVAPYSWTQRLVLTLESGSALEGRSYAENRDDGGGPRPVWGELSLTTSPVAAVHVSHVFEAHRQLLQEAQKHKPVFQEYRQRLKGLADPITEELDVLRFKRLIPGRCRYCPV